MNPRTRYRSVIAILVTLSLLVVARPAFADVNVCGAVGTGVPNTWAKANNNYLVTCTVTVPNGQQLTIEPGVVIRFAASTRLDVQAGGTLMANGTVADRITFTSDAATPAPGDWQKLFFDTGATVQLSFATIRYAGGVESIGLFVASSSVTLDNVIVRDIAGNGIQLSGAGIAPRLTNVTVQNATGSAISQETVNMNPIYSGLSLSGNGFDGVRITPETLNQNVTLGGATYFVESGSPLTVPSGQSLTIRPGTTLRMGTFQSVRVEGGGALTATGTLSEPVTFTSAQPIPAPKDWAFVDFEQDSHGRLGYCTIAYAGNDAGTIPALFIGRADVAVSNCTIRNSDGIGILIGGISTTVTIDTVLLANNRGAAIREAGFDLRVTYRNLTFENNGINGILGLDGRVRTVGQQTGYTPLSSGANKPVRALATSGPPNPFGESRLYAGGEFTQAGGNPVGYLARWDPPAQQWSPLGSGTNAPVRAIASTGSGATEQVYAGGDFSQAGGQSAGFIAQWNPATLGWNPLGSGTNGAVRAIVPMGTSLFVGGEFSQAGGQSTSNFAVWNTSTLGWTSVSGGPDGQVRALATISQTVILGGSFSQAGGVGGTGGVVGYNSVAGMFSAIGGGTNGTVNTIAVAGDLIYVGGSFSQAGGTPANNIAVYDPHALGWIALGAGTNGPVESIALTPSGLVAGGGFTQAGGQPTGYLAFYDGSGWRPLGSGANDQVYALATSGSSVYLGGAFTQTGSQPAGYVSRYGTPRALLGFPGILVNRIQSTLASLRGG